MSYDVKTVGGKTIKVFLADPLADQPASVKDKNPDLSYNCHGLTFNTRGIICADSKTRDFSIIDIGSPKILIEELYKLCTVEEAKALLAANKRPVAIFSAFTILVADEPGLGKKGALVQWYSHSAVPTAIEIAGQFADKDITVFTSKNGFDPLKQSMKLSEVLTTYVQTMGQLRGKDPLLQFYIAK